MKRLTISCMSTVVSKRVFSKCELQIEEVRINKIQKFHYLRTVVLDDGCANWIWRLMEIAKNAYQTLSKLLRYRKISTETTKSVLNSYVISILLCDSECYKSSSQMKRMPEGISMRVFRKILRIKWTDRVHNEEIVRNMWTKLDEKS